MDEPAASTIRVVALLDQWLIDAPLLLLRRLQRLARLARQVARLVGRIGLSAEMVSAPAADARLPVRELVDQGSVPLVPFRLRSGRCDPALLVVAVQGGGLPAGVAARGNAD